MAQITKAEYRAFELKIVNQQSEEERTVRSTLDHIQYSEYHPLALEEQIEFVDSWLCWGNTSDFKRICPNPSEQKESTKQNNLLKE